MPARSSYDYAAIRIVARVDREEFINAGVILFCLEHKYLAARIHLDQQRLHALSPGTDAGLVCRHLDAISRICAGDPAGSPIAKLSQRERFHWLVSPRSTIVQTSPVHSGLCESPEQAIDEVFRRLVL